MPLQCFVCGSIVQKKIHKLVKEWTPGDKVLGLSP